MERFRSGHFSEYAENALVAKAHQHLHVAFDKLARSARVLSGYVTEGPPPPRPDAIATRLTAYILDKDGAALLTVCGTASDDDGDTLPGRIELDFPALEEAHRAIFYIGDEAVGEACFAPALPDVSIAAISVRKGSTFVRVHWSGQAGDGAQPPLRFTLRYSANGVAWRVIIANTAETQHMVDLSQLPGGAEGRFQVIASAGLRSAFAQSETIVVEPTARQPHILSPQPGAMFAQGESIACVASAYSPSFRNPPAQEVLWSSPRFGYFGSGSHVTLHGLPVGKHWIELRVSDGLGNLLTRAIPIAIEPVANAAGYAPLSPPPGKRCNCH